MAILQNMEAARSGSQDAPHRAVPTLAAQGLSARTILTSAFYHRRVIILAALVPLLLGLAAAVMTKTEYTGSSLLMVLVNREYSGATQNVTDSGPAVLSIEGLKSVEAEVEILESADVILKTIEAIGEEHVFPTGSFSLSRLLDFLSPTQNRDDRLLKKFRNRLRATIQSDSNIIRVSFTHPDRDMAVRVTDKLVEIYLERRRQIFDNPTSTILGQEVDRFLKNLQEVDNKIQQVKAETNIIDLQQDTILAANQLDSILQRRRQVLERQAAVSAQLAEAERARDALPETVFEFAEKTNAVPNNDDQNSLTRLQVDRERLLQDYLPGHPRVRQIDRQIEAVQQALKAREGTFFSTDRDVRNPSIGYMNNMILSLQVERDALGNQIAELDEQAKAAEQRIAQLREAEPKLLDLTRERENLNDAHREYLRRAVAASIEETAADVRASNVRVVQRADSDVTSFNLGLPLLAAGVLGAILFGAAAWAVASVLRSVFIQPQEAEQVLKMPALAVFGDQQDGFNGPWGRQAISALAAQLADPALAGEPIRVIQIVAQDNSREAVAFSAGLATELSTAQGKRTLVIDHAECSAAPARAETEISNEGVQAVPTGTPNLWHAGRDDCISLFNLNLPVAETRATLGKLRETYDIVLVLTEAPQDIRIAQRLAGSVDANLIMIRSEETRAAVAVRLRDALLESGGGLLGFIFTGRRYYIPNWLYQRI